MPHVTPDLRHASVLVTGATGFLGAPLVARLLEVGAEVTVLTRRSLHQSRLAALAPRIRALSGDLAFLPATAPRHWPRPDIVFHLAARGVRLSSRDAAGIQDVNVAGTRIVLDYAQQWQVTSFVHFGSCGEYGNRRNATERDPPAPTTPYAAAKAAATALVQQSARTGGPPAVVLRPFSVYGPGEERDRIVSFIASRAIWNLPICLVTASHIRDFVFVEDVIDGAIRAADRASAAAAVFNLCTGVETSISELAETIIQMTGSASAVSLTNRPADPHDLQECTGSTFETWRALHWKAAVPLRAGLERTIDWVRTLPRCDG